MESQQTAAQQNNTLHYYTTVETLDSNEVYEISTRTTRTVFRYSELHKV